MAAAPQPALGCRCQASPADSASPRFPQFSANLDRSYSHTLIVNARLVPSVANFQRLQRLIQQWSERSGQDRNFSIHDSAGIALACLPTEQASSLFERGLNNGWDELMANQPPPAWGEENQFDLLRYAHDLIRFHSATFRESLEFRVAESALPESADGLFLGPGATVHPTVVADTTAGPILIDNDSQVGPFCFLRGPVYIGPGSRVNEHAAIKDNVAAGRATRLGGEVEESIIEPYSNKQHHGFLGHSYLGSWINLGAGTCNSDLKNTYGEINMHYRGQKVPTGMQFCGCIVGDYSKSAINTSIFTGKTIGVCSMLYGFVTTNVPSFSNYARSLGQVTDVPADVMIRTQQRMFARRNVEQRPSDIQLIHDMYQMSQKERELPDEPLNI